MNGREKQLSGNGANILGVLLFSKPIGMSSNTALQKVRRLFCNTKAGHTGTLDPFAQGLLPICFGEATKYSDDLLKSNKTYLVTGRLGWVSETGDAEGNLKRIHLGEPPRQKVIKEAIKSFVGEITQVPPMHSAIKINGKKMYELVRKGLIVNRKPRVITIENIHLVEVDSEFLTLKVSCSKGTYIRTLIEDIGERLGCGAYVTYLERISISGLSLSDAICLDKLTVLSQKERLLLLRPVDFMLYKYPKIVFDGPTSGKIKKGQKFLVSKNLNVSGIVRAYAIDGSFLGTGHISETREFRPKRLMATN